MIAQELHFKNIGRDMHGKYELFRTVNIGMDMKVKEIPIFVGNFYNEATMNIICKELLPMEKIKIVIE